MQRFGKLLSSFFFSRKFWIFVGALVTFLNAATADGVWSAEETKQLVLLFATYIASIAFEDGVGNRVNWNSLLPPGVLTIPSAGETTKVQTNTTTTVKSEETHA